jgi:hypothetical protein
LFTGGILFAGRSARRLSRLEKYVWRRIGNFQATSDKCSDMPRACQSAQNTVRRKTHNLTPSRKGAKTLPASKSFWHGAKIAASYPAAARKNRYYPLASRLSARNN